jgi:23S rRNA pseudouridine2604 synthase
MARITLKVTRKPAAVAPGGMSSRAKRAQVQNKQRRPPAAKPLDVAPVPAPAQRPARQTRPRTDRGKPRAVRESGLATPERTVPAPVHDRSPRHPNPDDPRLSKRMSELGLCSRREADEWIENGWVTVDGKVVDTLGVRVSPLARIEIAKAAAQHQTEQVTILHHKPIGYVSGQAEDGHTPASALITPQNRWADDPSRITFKPSHLRGLAPAGRLDIDSTGLLVFTQDGRVAKRLVGNHSEVEKEYLVRVEGKLDDAGMKLLQHGLELDGVKLKPARVSWQNEDQLRIVLREGRKRQIRRMCELVGLVVTGLKRVRTGSVSLGPLPVGQWRYLRRDEKF